MSQEFIYLKELQCLVYVREYVYDSRVFRCWSFYDWKSFTLSTAGNCSSLPGMCPSILSQELSPCPLFPYCPGEGARDTDPMIGGLLCMHTQSSQMQRQSPDNKETLERNVTTANIVHFQLSGSKTHSFYCNVQYIRQSDIDSVIQYSYDY